MDLLRSLYIHIPFCDNICSYCDFSHLLSRTNYQKRYLIRLKEDISKIKDKKLYSIYIGGGTPSSLSKEELEDLLSFLYSKFEVAEEFSFEANPESIDEEKVKVLVKYGVNRVSLGVQTVDEKHLKLLNRHHDIKTIKKACNILHRYNLNNINFDFIYGLEDEDESNIEKNIAFALENEVKHISYYSLQVEEGTVLYNSGYKVDDDKLATYYEKIVSRLEEVGFKRYEVSNFAKEGYESKHNLVYWQNKEYYGEGLS
ncbi:MAG: radical SAM family heme chaperone HemW, partial [Bacilli bacterium]|nr:radical SAM family heme chaperone HemW [Bacilli bacterium]